MMGEREDRTAGADHWRNGGKLSKDGVDDRSRGDALVPVKASRNGSVGAIWSQIWDAHRPG